jgi:hypothetical protein
MNRKILLIDFAVFSGVLNALIAWGLFDFGLQESIPVLDVFINASISLLIIVVITSIVASLSAGKMLKQGKMQLIDISSLSNIGSYISSAPVRLVVLAGVVCMFFSGFLFFVLKVVFINEVTVMQAGVTNIIFCTLIGLLFTPLVAINRVCLSPSDA